jgi:hypothetical protein
MRSRRRPKHRAVRCCVDAFGGRGARVAEQILDHREIRSAVEHRPGEVMPRVVGVQNLGKPQKCRVRLLRILRQLLDDFCREGPAARVPCTAVLSQIRQPDKHGVANQLEDAR